MREDWKVERGGWRGREGGQEGRNGRGKEWVGNGVGMERRRLGDDAQYS